MPKRRDPDSGDDSDRTSDYATTANARKQRQRKKPRTDIVSGTRHGTAEITTSNINRHSKSMHVVDRPNEVRDALLSWYSGVHAARGMPWRKPFDPSLGNEARAQRAYEVWVSEVMLQQTQVATVIPYYNRWMNKFPTLSALAASNMDEVNTLWKGLGYYSRAKRLLDGAQKVVREYGGMLPDNARDMEANVPGIGRYSAGAICSIAYGERVPVLDGNVHRLLSRLLALHALPKAKPTLDILWTAAAVMVQDRDITSGTVSTPPTQLGEDAGNFRHTNSVEAQHPGDVNQALIELGSTICKVREPNCSSCPLQRWCTAYAISTSTEHHQGLPDIEDACTLCSPTTSGNDVTVYPMKVVRKKVREELDVVNVIEWRSTTPGNHQRRFLVVKRPESGLLAGLHEFPTLSDVPNNVSRERLKEIPSELLAQLLREGLLSSDGRKNNAKDITGEGLQIRKIVPGGDIVHTFSHIKKTYRVQWVILEGGNYPPPLWGKGEKHAESQDSRDHDWANKPRKGKARPQLPYIEVPICMWVSEQEVDSLSIGTGIVKVWKRVQQLWTQERS